MIRDRFDMMLLILFIFCDVVFGVIAYSIGDETFGVLTAVAIITTVLFAVKK